LELALGAVTPQGCGILIGFVFHLPTPSPPVVHMLWLLPLHFSNGIIDLVIFVALTYHL
jgi:xanthosine utilization system XapX-like protein